MLWSRSGMERAAQHTNRLPMPEAASAKVPRPEDVEGYVQQQLFRKNEKPAAPDRSREQTGHLVANHNEVIVRRCTTISNPSERNACASYC